MSRSGAGFYGEDLAEIHVDGFDAHWRRAAPELLTLLRRRGIRSGLVLDLGCGGGEWSAELLRGGYDVLAVDVSPAMVRLAERRLPRGKVVCGSFCDTPFPTCDAITSLGEPLNYLASSEEIRRVFLRVYDALRPGGLFVFDVREPSGRGVVTRVRQGDGWTVIAKVREEPKRQLLVREITTYRREGRRYRRSDEVHRCRVYPGTILAGWLRRMGFRARLRRGYGAYRFEGPVVAVEATKPSKGQSATISRV